MTWPWAADTITRIRPVQIEDAHGDSRPDWVHATPAVLTGVSFAPKDDGDGGTVYATRTLDIASGDHLTWRGRRFEVIGTPQLWNAGTVVHVEGVDIPGQ